MSSGYNLVYDYPYILEQQRKVLAMEKERPLWQPQLTFHPHHKIMGGQTSSVASGRRSVGFKDLTTYSDLYKKVPQGYKSSGNLGNQYYNRSELAKINKSKLAHVNYSKKDYTNAVPGYSGNPQVYESIKKVYEDKNDYAQLEIPNFKPEKQKQVPKKKKGAGVVSGGKKQVLTAKERKILEAMIKSFKKTQDLKYIRKGGEIDGAGFKTDLAIATAKILGKEAVKGASKLALKKGLPKLGEMAAESLKINKSIGKNIGTLTGAVLEAVLFPKKESRLEKAEREVEGGLRLPVKKPVLSSKQEKLVRAALLLPKKKGGAKSSGKLSADEKKILEVLIDVVKTTQEPERLQGGKLDKRGLKKGLKKGFEIGKKGARKIAPAVVKLGIPAAATVLAQSLGVPAPIGTAVGKIAADVISKEAFGKGVTSDVAEFKGGTCVGGAVSGGMSVQKRRAALVKKIMKSEGLSLPEASKLIKAKGMKY
jgi:hypothetical protein